MRKTQKATKVSLNDVIGGTPNTSIDTNDVTGFVFNDKGIPVVNKKEIYPLVNATINAIAAFNTAKIKAELNKSKISEISSPIYDSVRGKVKSVKFINAKGRGIIVTYSDSYKLADGTETEGIVRQSLGEEQFNENFSVEITLKSKVPTLESVKELTEIFTKALGNEKLANAKIDEMFDITREVVAKKGMDARFNTLPENVRKSLIQKKPSISVF
jgi:hypothetical protein